MLKTRLIFSYTWGIKPPSKCVEAEEIEDGDFADVPHIVGAAND